MMEKKLILKYTLLNAIQHKGKANVQAVLNKVIGEEPFLREKIKELSQSIRKVVAEVNSWSLEKQKKKLDKIGIKVEKKRKERYEFPPLPDAKVGKVVTAFPPEPSKFPHLGHAKAALINYLYAKKYKGKFICRMEDTNPLLSKKEYYDAILEGLKWLGIRWDFLDHASDHLEKFYEHAEKLIKENKAYVCSCKPSEIRKNRRLMKECKCRENTTEENLKLWKLMLSKLEEGKASLRLRISMKHKNAAMRDPTIMRVIEHPHPRKGKKYRVWPTYDFATALMDAWEGITHRLRSKEFEMRKELQQFIQRCFGLETPYISEFARFNLKGVPSSGRVIREMIEKKELLGWDDPRLTTLTALRRRGFLPEAIKDFLISTGITKTEATFTWDMLESFNRSKVDPIANRYFCVIDPIEIKVKNAPKVEKVRVRLHPDFPERGFREIPVNTNKIFISREDFEKFKEKEIRLISLFNIKLNRQAEFTSKRVKMKIPKIQWVSEPNINIESVWNDGTIKKFIGEPQMKDLNINDYIQLIRIGFFRVDDINRKTIKLYFTHK